LYWQEEYETITRDKLEELQLQRLQQTLQRVYDKIPFYHQSFDEAGIRPGDVKSLADLQKVPFTVKQDLRDHYPFGLFTVPMDEVVRLHASSGTTGKPTVVGYTKKDIGTWSDLMARAIVMAGGSNKDVLQNAYGYGLFTGGIGVHYGAERMGATVVPISGGNTARQLMLMQDFGTSILTCTPSYALFLGEEIHNAGINLQDLKLRRSSLSKPRWVL